MIVVRLMGGLGNQMFQYAASRRLALQHGTDLKLDLSWFAEQSLRKYELDTLCILAEIATKEDLTLFDLEDAVSLAGRLRKFFRRAKKAGGYLALQEEREFHGNSDVLNAPDNVYLAGYWQTDEYFSDIRTVLLEEFAPAKELTPADQAFADKIAESTSVAVHVRRGDFVSNPKTTAFHGLCGEAYYEKAFSRVASRIKDAKFFIFSDDIPWSKENLHPPGETCFIERPHKVPSIVDLHMMRLCRHNIIANSSYSWWAAWLNENPDKSIIAPLKWFEMKGYDTINLIPTGWTRL